MAPDLMRVGEWAQLVVLQSNPASGLCGLPGGSTALPTAMLILQGVLIVLGIVKVGVAGEGSGDGDYGVNSGRVQKIWGAGIAALGVLLPQFGNYIIQMFGATASGLGLGCVF